MKCSLRGGGHWGMAQAVVGNKLKATIPWPIKLTAKIILSRLPIPYETWRALNLFRDGGMDNPAYALGVVRHAMASTGLGPRLDGLRVLELGPGDAVSSAVIAAALGARAIVLVDVNAHVRRDMAFYRSLLNYLGEQGLDVKRYAVAQSLFDLLRLCNAQYLSSGLQDLEGLAPASIDLIFSTSVLEHVRLHEFPRTVRALARAMAPGARAFHNVDLMDHLGGGLNHLRFPEVLWESRVMAHSGFYTNRLRMSAMLATFSQASLAFDVTRVSYFSKPPIQRRALAAEFRNLSEEDLRVAWFDVVWTRTADPSREARMEQTA